MTEMLQMLLDMASALMVCTPLVPQVEPSKDKAEITCVQVSLDEWVLIIT